MTSPIIFGADQATLTVPYVGTAEFRASPTWLDTNNLIEGVAQANQDAELYNVLLRASGWAWEHCDQPLHAHTRTENIRCRVDRYGRAKIHLSDNPVRSITGVAFGTDPGPANLTAMTDLSQIWIEDQRGLVVGLLPINGTFIGSLQFGSVPAPGGEIYVTIQYVAGFANTYISSAANVNDLQITVADPTGFTPPQTNFFGNSYGASVARIWDPAGTGSSEAVTVSNTYTLGGNPVKIASGLQFAHAVGVQVSEFPPEVRQAIIAYTVALLLREDTGGDDPYPGSPGPVARRSSSRGQSGGLIEEAERLLQRYRRVR